MVRPSETFNGKQARNHRNYQARKLRASYPGLVPKPAEPRSAKPEDEPDEPIPVVWGD